MNKRGNGRKEKAVKGAQRAVSAKASRKKSCLSAGNEAKSYTHPSAGGALRPESGSSPINKKKAPKTYRYDSSLSLSFRVG